MWTVKRDQHGPDHALRLRFYADEVCLSYEKFLRALVEQDNFRELIQDEMRAAPYVAFRWETPPVTSDNKGQPFSCLLHNSPELDVPADPTAFDTCFQPGEPVARFQNLGGDATLIAPCPVAKSANYSHMGSFHRTAPRSQQHALWFAVAKAGLARIAEQPMWLSTAGGGVDWLHVRLDDRPKYYRHRPWRNWQGRQ